MDPKTLSLKEIQTTSESGSIVPRKLCPVNAQNAAFLPSLRISGWVALISVARTDIRRVCSHTPAYGLAHNAGLIKSRMSMDADSVVTNC